MNKQPWPVPVLLLVLLLALASGAEAATRYVGSCGSPNAGSIAAAIAASATGDTILICPGTYTLNSAVVIGTSGLTLASSTGNRADVTIQNHTTTVVSVTAPNTTLRALTIYSNPQHAIHANGADNLWLDEVTSNSEFGNGLRLENLDGTRLTNYRSTGGNYDAAIRLVSAGNLTLDGTANAIGSRTKGIVGDAGRPANFKATNLTISPASRNTSSPITLSNAGQVEVRNSVITAVYGGDGGTAMALSRGTGHHVFDNLAVKADSYGHGIYLDGGDSATFTDTDIESTGDTPNPALRLLNMRGNVSFRAVNKPRVKLTAWSRARQDYNAHALRLAATSPLTLTLDKVDLRAYHRGVWQDAGSAAVGTNFTDITVTGATEEGVLINNGAGQAQVLRDVTVTAGRRGIELNGSSNAQMSNLTISAGGWAARSLYLVNPVNPALTGVNDITIRSGNSVAIHFQNCTSGGRVSGATVDGLGAVDDWGTPNRGIVMENCNNAEVSGNVVKNTRLGGIEISGSSHSASVHGNRVENSIIGIGLQANSGRAWNNCLFNASNASASGSSEFYSQPVKRGNYWGSWPIGTGYSVTCADGNGDGICDVRFGYQSGKWDEYPLKALPNCGSTPPGPHHIRIDGGTSGLTCQREEVTFKACADTGCTSNYTGGDVQVNFSPGGQWYAAASGGSALSNPQTIPVAGALTRYLQQTAPATVSVNAAHAGGPTPTGSPAVTCNNDTTAAPCSIVFTDAGLIFTNSKPGAETAIPPQISGVASGQLYVRAVKADKTTGACVSAVEGGTATIGHTCIDPSSCAPGTWFSTTGTRSFDAAGYAPFQFTYNDAGKIKLTASATSSTGGALSGESNAFVVKPYGFTVTDIKRTSDNFANPGAADAGGAAFMAAGTAFGATVSAVGLSGAITPSFGRESMPEGATLSRSLVSPAGGASGTLGGTTTIPGASFQAGSTKGQAVVTDLTWDEVGVITLKAGNGNYLGNSLGACTTETYGEACRGTYGVSGNVGRFIPKHFVLSAASITPAGGTFSYMDQPFGIAFTLTAVNASGGTTTNYAGSYAKLNATNPALWPSTTLGTTGLGLGAKDGSSDLSARLSVVGTPTGTWTTGANTAAASLKFSRPVTTAADATWGPYDVLDIGIAPQDADGVKLASAALNLDASLPAGAERQKMSNQTKLRFGRLWLGNAYGSDKRGLTVPYQAQYWNGSVFVKNTADNLTPFAVGNISLATALTTTPTLTAMAAGAGTIALSAPNAAGSVDVYINLGSTGSPTNCQSYTEGTTAARSYLSGKWCGTAYDRDPTARATFGIYGGKKGPIYIRESY